MITIFNRRELIITDDIAFQAKVREILSQSNIKYTFDVRTRAWLNIMRTEYKIFVHKKDLENARYLIRDAQTHK